MDVQHRDQAATTTGACTCENCPPGCTCENCTCADCTCEDCSH
ncbi:MAG TPA: hypothetical protein VFJ94_05260 [Intrasporangium sp.]|nr:hypothetical protein [Intrasporangium sp.]